MINVTVWNEFRHEKDSEHPASTIYPNGMHAVIADYLGNQGDIKTTLAALDDPEHGLKDEVLNNTDVLIWWGHVAHGEVCDSIVDKVQQRVLDGMGLIVLHSGHFSKIFKRLMGTSCDLKWRDDCHERLWVVDPSHPIVEGIPEYFELEEEMYGEHFDIPQPDEQVLISWFKGGEVFRSGNCWHRGRGKVFYFRPGHEANKSYYDANVMKIIYNGVKWAKPVNTAVPVRGHHLPLEK